MSKLNDELYSEIRLLVNSLVHVADKAIESIPPDEDNTADTLYREVSTIRRELHSKLTEKHKLEKE